MPAIGCITAPVFIAPADQQHQRLPREGGLCEREQAGQGALAADLTHQRNLPRLKG